jgi:hypothetical protein
VAVLAAGVGLQQGCSGVDSRHMERPPSLVRKMLRRSHMQRRRGAEKAWISRLPIGLALACAAGGLLSGCGGGQSAGSTSAALRSGSAGAGLAERTSLNRSPGALHPTKAEALAFAGAVNLTAADVPEGRISKKERRSASGGRHESEHCVGAQLSQRKLADVASPTLLRGHELETERIGSDVTVATSVGAADRLLATLGRGDVRHCLAQLGTQSLRRTPIANAHWGPVAVYALPVQAPGSNGRVGLRIALTVNFPASEVTVPGYVDVLVFAWGSADITLTATSLTQPVAASVESQLLATLLARARSHTL